METHCKINSTSHVWLSYNTFIGTFIIITIGIVSLNRTGFCPVRTQHNSLSRETSPSTQTHTHTRMHARAHTHAHTCTHTCTHTHTHMHTHTHTHMHIHMHTHTHTHARTHAHMHTRTNTLWQASAYVIIVHNKQGLEVEEDNSRQCGVENTAGLLFSKKKCCD